ncbi:MAG: gfo/Idh/MocA family oxidoreductase, partial [Proteobacteria bacterium]|nr:gfo/Idh/MocA family oxidoreductase [Pseudomonadota bacterium]
GELGQVHAIDLTFHNAYGPDKPWFYDMAQSGGGCVMDLGIHLIDLVQWICGGAAVDQIDARLYAQGRALPRPVGEVEDYASVQWRMHSGANVRMACSWRLPAGCDAVIEAAFYGSRGGAALRNVAGSFYDFTVDRFDGTQRTRLAEPPDAWGGRALVEWAQRLAEGGRFDPDAGQLVEVARIVDGIYGR